MDENASQALMIAFGLFVFVIAMSFTMYMFSKLSSTSEILIYASDRTNYYDNVEVVGKEGIERYVNSETVIPTLYRYYKEHFCVKIYDATGDEKIGLGSSEDNPVLVQILDVNLEGRVENAARDTKIKIGEHPTELKNFDAYSLKTIYDNKDSSNMNSQRTLLYMFGAPWIGSTDDMKLRVDFFINGDAGYINNRLVDYTQHPFHKMLNATKENSAYQFKENFISYSYTGETMTTEDEDVLVTGTIPKDKIVVTYTLVKVDDEMKEQIDKIRKK